MEGVAGGTQVYAPLHWDDYQHIIWVSQSPDNPFPPDFIGTDVFRENPGIGDELTDPENPLGGGAAGAGKSYALLLEPIRHSGNSKFRVAIFRRAIPQIKNEGGLWDTSKEVYTGLRDLAGQGATSTEQPHGSD